MDGNGKDTQNIFNKNFIDEQNNKLESNKIEEEDENSKKDFQSNFITSYSLSSQANDKTMIKNCGLEFLHDNDSVISTPSNSSDIPKRVVKEIEFCPMKNPYEDNKIEPTEKEQEFFPKYEDSIKLPFHINSSINTEIRDNYNISSSLNSNYKKDFNSVETKQVPKDLSKGSNIAGLYPKSMFSNIQIDAKAILNSLNDQKTTIILQKILIESDDNQIKNIVAELRGKYRQLILDKNGNFFCKDLFKICDQKERIEILKELSSTLSEDCCNNYGTHPIQTLVEFSSCEEEYKLILCSFNDYNKLLFATVDPNGAYVIQKIITRIPERFRGEFNFIFSSFICFVCKQKYGIVTVKKFIEYTKSEAITQQILNLIKLNFMNFALDKYGNYLIQYLLEKWTNFPEGKEIKDLIFINFNVMCKSKYSSFVCELFVKMLNNDEKNQIVKTLDLNEIKNSNNPHAIKILKNLGIFISNDTNINKLPLSLNNNMNNNSQQNFMNFGNQNNNNGNNFHGNRSYNYRQNNNNKNKHRNNKQ